MRTLLEDLRYGLRMMIKSPWFTAAAIVTLALGIGLNSAIFTIVNSLLLRPLPVKDAGRLVVLAMKDHHVEFPHGLSYPDYLDYKNAGDVFSDLIAYVPSPTNLTVGEQPERIWVELVSGNYFSMLGTSAKLGRVFQPEDVREH